MKGLVQRVSSASVTVEGELIGDISAGLLLLLGIERHDGPDQVRALCRKILTYRIFPDPTGRMNLSLLDTQGELLVVPQFTLAADTGSGTRPGFSAAAPPDKARSLFELFTQEARDQLGGGKVRIGRFGADMKVALINDGPVTFLLEATSAPT
ncbi:D-aminoacyl-tRNA deacylase [Marinobacter salicampi]|uniref:D-aminoacyl-tRNA deacylase n=1 Tax=Marinobacter salicampi TaxID=435907 RepID=UPI00140B7C5A|nr:D-aminoacyl-tRNA deacylase [Marinobacter salicampi]